MASKDSDLLHNPRFWDVLIAFLIIVPPILGATAWQQLSDPWRWIIAVPLILGAILVFYGSFIESRLVTVNKKSIQIPGLPNITIAVVADFHVGPYKGARYLERVVQKVLAQKADLILMPGDFLYDHHAHTRDLEPLKKLHAPLGVYAVLGNHDTGHMLLQQGMGFIPYRTPDRSHDIIRVIEEMGHTMMRNTHKIFMHDGKQFALVGADHRWMHSNDLGTALKDIPENMPVILLTHIPDTILDFLSDRASLIICGHTHGGQVRFPLIGPLYVPDELGLAYDQGIFSLKSGTTLAITHGVGETLARSRLFCPPEILLLRVNGGEMEN